LLAALAMLGPSGRHAPRAPDTHVRLTRRGRHGFAILTLVAALGCARRGEDSPAPTVDRGNAERIALAAASGRVLSSTIDSDGTRPVWRVELSAPTTRYRIVVEVDAHTGRVTSGQLDMLPDGTNERSP
jgi:hypothetical protein